MLLAVAAIARFPQYAYPLVLPANFTEAVPERRVRDEAGYLDRLSRWQFERMVHAILDESGADIRLEFVDDVPEGQLHRYSLERMRSLGVGRMVDRRGMLLVYDVRGKHLRIEVGPQLEGLFPDGFVGYLMREHAASFFESKDPVLGLRLTLVMIHNRLRVAALGMDYDPAVVSFITDSVRLAAGGGATAAAGDGVASRGFLRRRSTAGERARFGPQPTVMLAYQRYLEWLREAGNQVDIELFTPDTRTYLRQQAMTRAYNDGILLDESGQSFRIEERGPRALLYFTSTPLVSPHYFRQTPAGWQMDIQAEVYNTVNYGGLEWTYFLTHSEDDFSYAFADMMDDYGRGMLRIRDGDNRPLPMHSPR